MPPFSMLTLPSCFLGYYHSGIQTSESTIRTKDLRVYQCFSNCVLWLHGVLGHPPRGTMESSYPLPTPPPHPCRVMGIQHLLAVSMVSGHGGVRDPGPGLGFLPSCSEGSLSYPSPLSQKNIQLPFPEAVPTETSGHEGLSIKPPI